jgi:hypothetical protein
MAVSSLVAAGGGLIRKSTSFTSSGTFTLPAGYGAGQPLIVDIEICGGGGGGGSGAIANSGAAGGGGGGGSGITTVYRNIPLTANATVTIGAAGAGGNARGGTAYGFTGATGGTSNVNSLYYAPGGGGGGGGNLQSAIINYRAPGVNSFGFYVPGGYANASEGAGGGGGSGGGAAVNLNSGQFPIVYGGSRGSAGLVASLVSDGATAENVDWSTAPFYQGKGLAAVGAVITSGPTASALPNAGSNEILVLQRGAGGGGGKGNVDNQQSGGGTAGTRFNGGRSGYNDSTSVTGSRNGTAATDAGCGGGGGSGIYAGSGLSGSGGAGAAGYCIIYYWG